MVGYRPSRHPAAYLIGYANPAIIDAHGNPLSPPLVDNAAFDAVAALLDAAWAPDHKEQLKAVMDETMERLTDSHATGELAILHRYLWCYGVLEGKGADPSDRDLAALADHARPKFAEIVTEPDLLADLVAVPFRGESTSIGELTFGQRLMLTAVAVVGLEDGYGDATADEVHRSVTSRDWCVEQDGISVVVDPTAATDWVRRCSNP